MGNAGSEGHGGFSNVGQNLPVGYCIASSTSSAGRAGNFCLDVVLLQVAMGLCFVNIGSLYWLGGGLVG